MCEVESSVTTGNGRDTPSSRLSVSCPEETHSAQENTRVSEGLEDPSEEHHTSTEYRRGSVGTREPLGVMPRVSKDSIVDDSVEVDGVDPFKPTETSMESVDKIEEKKNDHSRNLKEFLPPLEDSLCNKQEGRRDSKTVSFKEPEIEDDSENESNSITKNESKQEEGSVEKRLTSGKQRSLGEKNPVYRLSMKLSPNLFNMQEIPGATQHREADKAGYLTKLSGRTFPYIAPQWKRRYCVLSKGRLYYYDREDSKGGDKGNGVINLEYFDQVTEALPKDCKKATNVFLITSQDRSFFDPGRHLFSADTLPDMRDWVRKLQYALEQIRNNNRPSAPSSATPPASLKKESNGKRAKEQQVTENRENKDNRDNKENRENVQNSTIDRKKKKKESQRPRKSARVGDGSETPGTPRREREVEMMTSSGAIQLPGMVSPRGGVQLPGLLPTKKEPSAEETNQLNSTAKTNNPSDLHQQDTNEGLPSSGPTLTCVTKQRNKGPQGRRAPQNRRTLAASSLKKRASSLSALEFQDLNDNSEAPWLNRSLDMLDEPESARNGGLVAGRQPSLPYKAYTYSTDEEGTDDDEEHSLSDSFPTSAAAMPPPPPPRSASYGLELRQNPPLGQASNQTLHRSLGDAHGSGGDIRGSKRSLGDGRMYGMVGEWRGSSQWIGSHSSLGQNGEILGSASPVMDDLDNMLMNQSIQQTSLALESNSESGSEGSTCKATGIDEHCQVKASHPSPAIKRTKHSKKPGPDLSRFAVAVKHLQRHVVEIDRAVFSITGDVTGTKQEVTALKQAVLALQTDTDTITSTLSHLTEEAISAQQKISFASQEAEKVRKVANMALKEAEQARHEQLKSRMEYERLLEDMKAMMKNMKTSPTSYTQEVRKTTVDVPKKEVFTKGQEQSSGKSSISKANIELKMNEISFKPPEECLRASSPKSNRTSSESQTSGSSSSKTSDNLISPVSNGRPEDISKYSSSRSPSKSDKLIVESLVHECLNSKSSGNSTGVAGPLPVSKSNSYTQVSITPKVPAYQSLFARPSSLISGLAQRSSLTKSVSFADQKDKDNRGFQQNEYPETKKNEDQKQITSLERKDKKDSKTHLKEERKPTYETKSLERKKEKKESGSIDRRERKHRHSSRDKHSNHRGSKDEEHKISNLSLEDIPMADDHSSELLDRVGISTNTSTLGKLTSLSSSTQTPSNFSLGKSSSSPVVSPSIGTKKQGPVQLCKDHLKNEHSVSTTSTTETSMPPSQFQQVSSSYSRPTSPYSRSSTALPTVEENQITKSSSYSSMHRPGSTPGPLARQGSMTTVPEDRAIVAPPPPSRPGVFAISRQNSSPNLPIQRQNSAASIPLQRQHSLGTVPEDGRLPRQDSMMSIPENRLVVDQTLPLSPSQSLTYFPISPSASASTISPAARRAAITSMELVTGPILAGSSMQEASATGTLAVLTSPEEELKPASTSTLRKDRKQQRTTDGVAS